MRRRRSVDTFNLDEVRTRFENWRQNRRSKQRIPEELWSAAIEVARRDGVNPTAATLHLDGGNRNGAWWQPIRYRAKRCRRRLWS